MREGRPAGRLWMRVLSSIVTLLLLGPAVALTPLVWQRLTHLPQPVLETSDAPEPSR